MSAAGEAAVPSVDDVLALVAQRVFVGFIRPDRYPRPVGVLIDRGEDGRWEVQPVSRWDDTGEAERRYGEFRPGCWSHLEWVR